MDKSHTNGKLTLVYKRCCVLSLNYQKVYTADPKLVYELLKIATREDQSISVVTS